MGCCFPKPEIKILILGLQNSGKTTTMLRIGSLLDPKKSKLPLDKPPPPTLGQNMDRLKMFGRDAVIIDMGGEKGFRPYWDYHFPDVAAVVWVLDGAYPPHFEEAKEVFHRVVSAPSLEHSPFLFLVNKCDLPECAQLNVVTRAMGIEPAEWDPHRPFRLLRVSALLGNGVLDAFRWLVKEVDKGQQKRTIQEAAASSSSDPISSSPPPAPANLTTAAAAPPTTSTSTTAAPPTTDPRPEGSDPTSI
nr:Arfrp1b [Paratrimastix pyriformis]